VEQMQMPRLVTTSLSRCASVAAAGRIPSDAAGHAVTGTLPRRQAGGRRRPLYNARATRHAPQSDRADREGHPTSFEDRHRLFQELIVTTIVRSSAVLDRRLARERPLITESKSRPVIMLSSTRP